MNLSPTQKAAVVETVARMIVAELREEVGGSFANLYCIELAVAEKMTGLNRKTLRGRMPVVEMSDGKHAVKLRDLQSFLDKKTIQPAVAGERAVA